MNKARDLKHIVLGAVLTASGLSALAAVNLTSFAPGTPIKSNEVNANFSSLGAAIQALEAPIGPSRLAVTGTAADGKVLKFQAGELVWGDDQIGTGSGGGDISAVGAGAGLEGGGASGDVTLSIAGAFRLPQGCTNGQIPKWGGTAWACGDDGVGTGGGGGDITAVTAGTGLSGGGASGDVSLSVNPAAVQSRVTGTCAAGSSIREVKQDGSTTCEADDNTTYTADGSSLGLGGTTFFVKSNGIGTALIADGAVTASKIAFPLNLSGDTSSVAYTIKNTNPSGMGLRVDLGNQPNSFVNTPIMGQTTGGIGMFGLSTSGTGVSGQSETGTGVGGRSTSANGVVGQTTSGNGVGGQSSTGAGVSGASASGPGVKGVSSSNNGVSGTSGTGYGVFGTSPNGSGVGGTSSGGYAAEFTGGKFGSGTCYYAGGAGWSCTSDRNKKENFRAVNARAVLEALSNMPVTRWNMKGDANRTPHMGPVAQDFKAAFGLGEGDTTINTADAQGVALAAIKGLNAKLETENAALRASLATLEARLSALEKASGSR